MYQTSVVTATETGVRVVVPIILRPRYNSVIHG